MNLSLDTLLRKYPFSIILILVFSYMLWKFCFGNFGYNGFDDMYYMEYAANLVSGEYSFASDAFGLRWLPIGWQALFFSVFGINEWSTWIGFVLVYGALLCLVYSIARSYFNYQVGYLAVALLLSFRWLNYYADKAMPDILLALIFLLIFKVFLYGKLAANRIIPFSILLAILLMLGILTKETIVFVIPLIGYLFWASKNHLPFNRTVITFSISFVILLVIYFFSLYLLTDDWLYRLIVLAKNNQSNSCINQFSTSVEILNRVGLEYWVMFITTGAGIIVFPALGYSFNTLLTQDAGHKLPLIISFLLLILIGNFCTVSLTTYAPLCTDIRHYFFILPFGAILSAFYLLEYMRNPKGNKLLLAIVFLLLAIAYYHAANVYWYLYLPLFILMVIVYFYNEMVISNRLLSYCLLVVILFFGPSMSLYKEGQNGYYKNGLGVNKIVEDERFRGCIVVSDALHNYLLFHFKYNIPENIQIIPFSKYKRNKDELIACEQLYFLYSEFHNKLEGYHKDNLPEGLRHILVDDIILRNGDAFFLARIDQ